MKIKRFFAKDMRTALKEVKDELGVDAVIMSNKKLADGVEIVAAVDYDPKPTAAPTNTVNVAASASKPVAKSITEAVMASTEPSADSLQALLKRQQRATQAMSGFEQVLKHAREVVKNTDTEDVGDWYKPKTRDTAHQDRKSLNGDLDDGVNLMANAANAGGRGQSELDHMREEMASIRKLLEFQLSGLVKQERGRSHPTKAHLLHQLTQMGIDDEIAEQMAAFVPADIDDQTAWQKIMQLLIAQVKTTDNDILRRGGVYAFVGPTGAGKTTTVAKIAALFAQKHGRDSVALLTTDTYRIGAYEQLSTYGRIIGCPVKHVKDADELADVLFQFRNKKLVLIDTAGMSQRDIRLAQQLDSLINHSNVPIKSYLVLSATAQLGVLNESVKQFKRVKLSGCIFTKLDESLSLGEIISVAIHNALPIGYLTNGQRVPEDIRVANAEKLVRKAEQLFEIRNNNQLVWQSKVESRAVGMYD